MPEIKRITAEDLRHMEGVDGMIFRNCEGDPQKWIDGINDEFTDCGILADGTLFENVSIFENKGITCLLFQFDEFVSLDLDNFAAWILRRNWLKGMTFLQHYVEDYLGGFIKTGEKPKCLVKNHDVNIFSLIASVSRTLKESGNADLVDDMRNRVYGSFSYDGALSAIRNFVDLIFTDDDPDQYNDRDQGEESEKEQGGM